MPTTVPSKKQSTATISRPCVLTRRDLEILGTINSFRFLTASQIQKLHFGDNRQIRSTQRRLHILFGQQYLSRTRLPFCLENGSAEYVYTLGKNGKAILAATGTELAPFAHDHSGHSLMFLDHALRLSQLQLIFTLALKNHPLMELVRFTPDFALTREANKKVGQKRFALYTEIETGSEKAVIFPDALIELRGKGEFSDEKALYFFECDRGTQSIAGVVAEKVKAYSIFHRQRLFQKFGDFADFTVLYETTSQTRAENIQKHLKASDTPGRELVWLTSADQVDAHAQAILTEHIWINSDGERCSILDT